MFFPFDEFCDELADIPPIETSFTLGSSMTCSVAAGIVGVSCVASFSLEITGSFILALSTVKRVKDLFRFLDLWCNIVYATQF